MKLKQVAVLIENAPGRLYEITQALGDAGINLRALNLVDTGEFGILRLLVSDLAKTRRILMEKQMPAKVDEVVAAEIED
ncbi:MAG: amino acid-binding protein, partial [Proteobacteria bacterium]|nr:amino acid-binding protein [Pseudomonadota bacterium]